MKSLISSYIDKISKEDIIKFAHNNNLNVSDDEINFVLSFIKNDSSKYLNNPSSFDISIYKNKFSNENYIFLENLINKYKHML